MGNHINKKGWFQSDKYPQLPPDKLVLSFDDIAARSALLLFANETTDKNLARDIKIRLRYFCKDKLQKRGFNYGY